MWRKINLIWSANCSIMAITVANQGSKFSVTDGKRCFPLLTLSTQDNAKLLEQLKSGFKRSIKWSKYQSKESAEDQTHI